MLTSTRPVIIDSIGAETGQGIVIIGDTRLSDLSSARFTYRTIRSVGRRRGLLNCKADNRSVDLLFV
ncbi:hypothetical protein THS27_05680 [Thalassospira sp. MCCC 1A01428]|nr:hypothetical protein THS27_05680 [Thalassospira sp. MCCC 1A01428]